MTKIAKGPVVEWQLGRLESGRVSHEMFDGGWSLLDPADLHWYGFNRETYSVGNFLGASNSIFDGRQAVAHVMRQSKRQVRPSVTCFVELPTHYVSNAGDERECRAILDLARHAFDHSKPVLCRGGLDDFDIAVLPVYPTDPVWIGAVYRLRTEEAIDPRADTSDPSVRAKVRNTLAANQAIRDRFVLDPIKHRDDATCYALVSVDGDTSLSVEGCTFADLLATPSSEVSARLLREMTEESSEPLLDAPVEVGEVEVGEAEHAAAPNV